ncbi:DNA gyrase subunit A [Bacteriovoracaceae bacterium]|nr:DNA gyrase subunit A [Bacteriovoracaceae bacterium]
MSDENTTGGGEHNHGNIAALSIQDEMKNCYLDYAMSVIVGRALPDVRDGLKPVHRRILYAMHMLNNVHNRPYLKSARIVGDVIGKYHPHGDSAVYGAIVRLAQDFSMRYPIIDGQGNFGSIDGDNAAAMRYTEVRMKKLTSELLQDIDKDTVDWQTNYDGSLTEPTVLPTRIPNLLINGSSGIAVGMATNIPPHNVTEILNGLIALIEEPNLTINQLMEFIPGPDFPTHGFIHGTTGIKSAYHTGKGVLQIRAKAEIEVHGKQDRERIVITEIPYQVNKARLIEKVATLVNQKSITGISDIRDESNKLGIRVVIDIKRGESGNVILNRLYKHTQLQVSFGIIFLSIHNGQPKVLNLKDQLQYFIDHRREVVIRRTKYQLKKAKARAHILEGLKTAVENIDELVEMIKSSEGPVEAKSRLMSHYKLSEIQAQAVLDMRLQRLTGLERDKIIAEYNEIIKEIKRLEDILNSEELIRGIIKNELQEILETYQDERRTQIVQDVDQIEDLDLIDETEVIVTLTHKGYLKRMAHDTYKSQKRGGKGVKGAGGKDDDFYTKIFTASTHDQILFFTTMGKVFTQKVYQIPEGSRTAKGRNIVNLIPLGPNERLKEIITIPKDIEGNFLVFATKNGLIKRSKLEDYKNINQSGIRAIKVNEGDEVVSVRVSDGTRDILMCASSGKIIRFNEKDARPMGRVSQGVRGINISEKEFVIGMELIDDSVEILSVTENGYGKRSSTSEYRVQSRGGKGIIGMKLTDKNGEIVEIKPVVDTDDLVIITNTGQVIRIKIAGISLIGRNTQGVRLINLKGEEKVVAVESIEEEDEE